MVAHFDIAKEIREIRGSLEMSRQTFARIVGVTPATVQNWENGKWYPNEDQLDLIRKLGNIENPPEKDTLKKALVTGGVAFGLFLLLKKIFEKDQ